jgi:hypothetical protein
VERGYTDPHHTTYRPRIFFELAIVVRRLILVETFKPFRNTPELVVFVVLGRSQRSYW